MIVMLEVRCAAQILLLARGLLPSLGYGQRQPQLLTSTTGLNVLQRCLQLWLSKEATERTTHSALNLRMLVTELCRAGQDRAVPASQYELCLCPILLPAYVLSRELIPDKNLRP